MAERREELTLGEIAEERDVNISTVWRWICEGLKRSDGGRRRLPSHRPAGRRLVYRDDLDEFLSGEDDPLAVDFDGTPASRRSRVDSEAEALVG